MRLPKSFTKPKCKPLLIRRVQGQSMLPVLRSGQLVAATALFKKLTPGTVVVIRHNDLEKIKRVQKVKKDSIFVIGDNPLASTDSRSFGWLDVESVIGKIIWPRI